MMPNRALILAVSLYVALLTVASAGQRLPGGGVAVAEGGGPVTAWYGRPTDRYAHAVLGDAIEGGSLVVIDDAGRRYEHVLSENQVFEDLTPRLVDLDGDGRNEVVTIRTDVGAGAAVAVYALRDGKILERAAAAPIGRPNRWLSIAAIADFNGDGRSEIAVVKTPHIGGVLEILALRDHRLVALYPAKSGFSTHVIGSTILSLAAAGDITGNGRAELALPDQSRRRLVVLGFGPTIETLLDRELPARIGRQVRIGRRGRISVPLETSATAVVHFR